MIFNLRGGSCSGKSTPIYRLLAEHREHVEPIWETGGWNIHKSRCVGYRVGDLLVVGPYETQSKTGGLDMLIGGKTELVTLWLEQYLTCGFKHVIYESMLASLAMGRYQTLARHCENGPAGRTAFCFLNTPLEVRRARLYERNGGAGRTGKGVNEAATIDHQQVRLRVILKRFAEAGELVYVLDHTRVYEQLVALLQQEGWNPQAASPVVNPPPTLYDLGRFYNSEENLDHWPEDEKRRKQLAKELDKPDVRRRLRLDVVQSSSDNDYDQDGVHTG